MVGEPVHKAVRITVGRVKLLDGHVTLKLPLLTQAGGGLARRDSLACWALGLAAACTTVVHTGHAGTRLCSRPVSVAHLVICALS